MIKNHTPFLGKVTLSVEKNPYWESNDSYLNKVHLKIGRLKVVSRIKPRLLHFYGRNSSPILDSKKVELINRHTGGIIKDYELGEPLTAEHIYLPNSFLHNDGRYIGDARKGWWYYQNKMFVTDFAPNQVARVVNDNGDTIGYYGYSHRGGCTFKIGDCLFDPNYTGNLSRRQLDELPFTKRGSEKIKNWKQAQLAALLVAQYLG